MRDIKLTLSQDKKRRSPTVEDEAEWVNLEKEIFYPLQACPREAQVGCRVYFIRAGQLVARAKADEFRHLPVGENRKSYTGVSEEKGGWHVLCSSMDVLPKHKRLLHEPPFFQGFRYVTPTEQASFERVFR
jgi:hypothetical protein